MANQKISVELLAADEQFQQWVASPTPEREDYWKEWTKEHPEHQSTLADARQLLLHLQLTGEPTSANVQQEVWANLQPVLKEKHSATFYNWSTRAKVGVAAALATVAAASILLFTYLTTTTNYQTAYGETKEITLPDGSTLMLNANSSVRFASDWQSVEVREVWLEGEAFFNVRQISLSADGNVRLPFIVHSQNMDVEVLGTTFNVKDRQEYSEVVLNTGKVSVTPQMKQQTAPIAMNPGDRLAYSANEQAWRIQQVNPEIPTAWRHQELIFDEMQLKEIAQLLEDVYGYDISFATVEMESYTFTGNIKTDEIELLLPMLGRSFGLQVQQDDQKIHFNNK